MTANAIKFTDLSASAEGGSVLKSASAPLTSIPLARAFAEVSTLGSGDSAESLISKHKGKLADAIRFALIEKEASMLRHAWNNIDNNFTDMASIGRDMMGHLNETDTALELGLAYIRDADGQAFIQPESVQALVREIAADTGMAISEDRIQHVSQRLVARLKEAGLQVEPQPEAKAPSLMALER